MVNASASAQEAPSLPARPLSPSALERIARDTSRGRGGVQLSQQSGSAARRKDSIVNGGLIGAVIGGVGGSFLIVAASGGSDDFPRAMRKVAAVPAAGGFAIGALIDALH
jgi:hypothetical protein